MTSAYRGLGDIIVTARPYGEYVAMFGLDDDDVVAGPILDCPAGACGFAAGVRARGGRVTAVDPEYALPHDELMQSAHRDAEVGSRYISEHADSLIWTHFADPADHLRQRLRGLEQFDADRRAHPDDYVDARLPSLPFDDGAFRLVLSSHLLFLYPDHLDYDAHLDCARELARVSSGEVRIFPLVDTTLERWPHEARLRDDLAREGVASELRHTDFAFFPGATEMLVLRRTA